MPKGICPECDEEIYVDPDLEQGDVVTCEECGIELEITNTSPVELSPYEGHEYDEYDDYDYYDEDEDYIDYESYDYDYDDDRY